MNPVAQAVLASWTIRPGFVILLLVVGAVYARGFSALHAQMPERFPRWRLAAFLVGLATLLVAIASPLDTFSGLLLQVHMIQHLLLMLVAPPLLLLGAPAIPLLRGLPRVVAKDALGPFLAWPALQRLGHALTHPVVCWLALAAATWGWHIPAAYQLALRSPAWHAIEHASFVGVALLFWWPVVLPWPSRAHWPRWAMVPYLLLADVQNTIFSAFFTFSDRLIYPFYASVPRLGGVTPLADQITAGAIMWVPASLFFLIPGAVVMLRALSPQNATDRSNASYWSARSGGVRTNSPPGAVAGPRSRQGLHPWLVGAAPPGLLFARARVWRFDLLKVPLIGPLLRWPHFRRVAQGLMLILAIAVVADGMLGPQVSPMNLAGVLPWTYWRGLTVVGLLAVGNIFCLACPFMLPRELGRRIGLARLRWPRQLRSKWPAVVLLVMFFWGYETFDLWDSPWWTAWIIVGYFACALVVDAFFAGASFCKYICPIGQFHFIQSLVSPFEVQVREPQACARCTTHDCLRGNERHRGCELGHFLPRKVGSLDCTFCFDCVQACPHDNIGLLAVAPGNNLMHDPERSALGRLSRRADVAALAIVLIFGAFVSAAAMVAPISSWQQRIALRFALDSPKVVMSVMLLCALVIAPPVICGLAALGGQLVSGVKASARELRHRFVLALVPLGLAMWAAHFLFHLLTGLGSVVPVAQRVLWEIGYDFPGTIGWLPAPVSADLLTIEILLLDAGLLLSLYVAWRIASGYAPRARKALALVAPWVVVAVGLYVGGVWTFLQPMQMRGTMMHARHSVAMVHR